MAIIIDMRHNLVFRTSALAPCKPATRHVQSQQDLADQYRKDTISVILTV